MSGSDKPDRQGGDRAVRIVELIVGGVLVGVLGGGTLLVLHSRGGSVAISATALTPALTLTVPAQ